MPSHTQFAIYPAPEPLSSAPRGTLVSWLVPDPYSVLRDIEVVLAENCVPTLNPLERARARRTRLLHEPAPLEVPALAALKPAVGTSGRSEHLESCVATLQDWLGIGLADVCVAAGINRGTVYAWRSRGSEPRPATVSGVLGLHGLVSSAVNAVGEQAAREWFHRGDPSPLRRLIDSHGDPAAASAVAKELRRTLLRVAIPARNPLLGATLDDAPARPLV